MTFNVAKAIVVRKIPWPEVAMPVRVWPEVLFKSWVTDGMVDMYALEAYAAKHLSSSLR